MSEEQVKVLEDVVEVEYKWNPGPVVGRFLTDLRDNKEITAVRCTRTSKVFLPPQSVSPYGQNKMDRFVSITSTPKFRVGTIVYKAPWNKPEGIDVPYMLAAVDFAGADTQLLHIVKGSEEELKALKAGDSLKPKWKDEPVGTVRDLDYFEIA